jgi:hypothetical protein
MSLDRDLVRAVAPPILALGLVVAVVRPLEPATLAPAHLATGPTTLANSGGHASADNESTETKNDDGSSDDHSATNACGTGGGNVCVSIPAVAFTSDVRVVDGRLHTPVLLASAGVTARARVVGTRGTGTCSLNLRQGEPQFLDCAIPKAEARNVRIVVSVSDGRTVVRALGKA